MPERAETSGSFYVGYLKTPLRLIRFLAFVSILVVLLADGLALVLYRLQADRPSGRWGENGEIAISGTLVARPYPMVMVAASADRPARVALLVSVGKVGAPATARDLDGKAVTVYGYPLLRDDLTVLQLSRDLNDAAANEAPRAIPVVELGVRTLTGQIEDAKCFFGAMNPGEGKVHKACASLCLLGGIPPLFITRDAQGHITYRILADEDGGPISDLAADRASEVLTLTGKLSRLGAIEVFAVPQAALK